MAGMHCDSCGGLFEYNEQLIAVHRDNGELLAGYATEKEGGSVGETFRPCGKYHLPCYDRIREQQPDEWPPVRESG